EATRRIREQTPDAHVVVLTSFTEEDRFAAALAAGAIGYLIKDSDPEDVIDAVRAAAVGHAPIDPRMARALLPGGSTDPRLGAAAPTEAPTAAEGRVEGLSLREREVLSLVAGGLANKQIARALSISDRTVKTHLANIFRNIGVADRTSAAMWARDHGIV
ncbi:MAG TPA: response regulator transcription factor, partial [Dermatophilaceae bacterium]|nr:response regulator transcription factor [Dermatophilaceae bacterium]